MSTTANPTSRERRRWLLDFFGPESLADMTAPLTTGQQRLLDGFLHRHDITGPDDPDFATKLGIRVDPAARLALLVVDEDRSGARAFVAAVAHTAEVTR